MEHHPINEPSIHPELFANIPEEWRQALREFVQTGSTLVPGFSEYLDNSSAAQEVVEIAFEASIQGAARRHLERVEQAGSLYEAAEQSAERMGVNLDTSLAIEGILSVIAERVRREQEEVDSL